MLSGLKLVVFSLVNILMKSQNPRTLKEAFAFRGSSVFNVQRCEKRQKEQEILITNKDIVIKQGLMYRNDNGEPKLKELFNIPERERPTENKYPIDPKTIDKRGVVNIYELPIPGTECYAGVDSVEADITVTSESLFSIHIYRRSYIEQDKTSFKSKVIRGRIVADWCGRFDTVDETNEHAMLLLEFYKAKASCERNKPNFINHCRRNGKTSYIALTKELPFDKDVDVTGRDNGQYGVFRDASGVVS